MNHISTSKLLYEKALSILSSGRKIEAAALFQSAIEADESNYHAMHQLAMILAEDGEHEKAKTLYREIVEIVPNNRDAILLLGVESAETGDYAAAIECFRKCVELHPENCGYHKMLGIALAETGDHITALNHFEKAAEINPQDSDALTRMAIEQIYFLDMAKGEKNLLRAIELDPENALAYNNIGRAYKFQGRISEAEKAFRKGMELDPENPVLVDNLLLTLNYLNDRDPVSIFDEHKRLTSYVYRNFKKIEITSVKNRNNTIRVGYVSGDFHHHSVMFFFEPVLINHNHTDFEIYCYSNDTREDETTKRLKSCGVNWRLIAKRSDMEAAKLIADDGIDILFDLAGHSSENRLGIFALKPAPIQASWLGYPHSTGLEAIDYYFSDNLCDPVGITDHLFTEKVLRLPEIFSCYLPPVEFPPITAAPYLKNGFVTFASFNNFAKVSQKVLDIWGELLLRVPDSRLLLKSFSLGDILTASRVIEHFKSKGISEERLSILKSVNSPLEHLALYGETDIALDTFPYNGTTTSCEALWMGVPVITIEGMTHSSRVGLAITSAICCSELCANSLSGYINNAVELAMNPDRISLYRSSLRLRMANSQLMNYPLFVSNFEKMLKELVDKNR